jgi:hypothetical protein
MPEPCKFCCEGTDTGLEGHGFGCHGQVNWCGYKRRVHPQIASSVDFPATFTAFSAAYEPGWAAQPFRMSAGCAAVELVADLRRSASLGHLNLGSVSLSELPKQWELILRSIVNKCAVAAHSRDNSHTLSTATATGNSADGSHLPAVDD